MTSRCVALFTSVSLAFFLTSCCTYKTSAQAYTPPEKGPSINWAVKSDWQNVKTDFELKAVGDGVADDTAAIQAALSSMQSRRVLYFPAGTYRITKTLIMPGSISTRGLLIKPRFPNKMKLGMVPALKSIVNNINTVMIFLPFNLS